MTKEEVYENIYNICLALNDEILIKSNKDDNLTFFDHYIFQSTTFF